MTLLTILAGLSLAAWLYLMALRGRFWRADQRLAAAPAALADPPEVAVVIPARNEAEVIGPALASLIGQDYSAKLTIILVDDHSDDGTREAAEAVASAPNRALHVVDAGDLPAGWSGKLWAVQTGIAAADRLAPDAEYLLLTDADIAHAPDNLTRLVAKAAAERLDLVSLMVRLACERGWARLLVPAFVFFFQKLYPFPWVNDPARPEAAAAGGCMLVRREALARAGGIESIRTALIDDCALGARIKSLAAPGGEGGGGIWLGLADDTVSLRPYPDLRDVWEMVARTAFTQLRYSPLLLAGTLAGMVVIYLVPPAAVLAGAGPAAFGAGLGAWLLMAAAFWPTLKLYGKPAYLAPALPLAGLLYTAMTVDSAIRHWRGRSVTWKGRVYSPAERQ